MKYTFLLSLFFELTQLTGLNFIYPRQYRLFDVDDLMINMLGGILGYFIMNKLKVLLPSREEINDSVKVSVLRKIHPYEEPAIDIIPLIDEDYF